MFKFEIQLGEEAIIGLSIASVIISIVSAIAAYNIISILHAVH